MGTWYADMPTFGGLRNLLAMNLHQIHSTVVWMVVSYILTDRNDPSVILSEVFWWKSYIILLHLITVYLHVHELEFIENCQNLSLSKIASDYLVMLSFGGKKRKNACFQDFFFVNQIFNMFFVCTWTGRCTIQ